jgi:hypothetical protein
MWGHFPPVCGNRISMKEPVPPPTAQPEKPERPEPEPEKKPDDYYGPLGIRFNDKPILRIWTGFGYR